MRINFNTSHVTVYLFRRFIVHFFNAYFNTSHVTVYLVEIFSRFSISSFQYIPCYCLSRSCCSHDSFALQFQYIPCYCLSKSATGVTSDEIIFQYIPCYCLSNEYSGNICMREQFQYIPCYCLSNEFNPFLLQAPSSFPLFYAISTFFTSRL